jgi:hypothetical protein
LLGCSCCPVPPTTTDDLRDLMEPLLSILESGVAETRKLPAVGYGSDVREWTDARVFDHQLPLARRGPRSLPGSARVNVLQLGHEVRVPQRIRAQLRATRPPGTAAEAGRGPYSERRP